MKIIAGEVSTQGALHYQKIPDSLKTLVDEGKEVISREKQRSNLHLLLLGLWQEGN